MTIPPRSIASSSRPHNLLPRSTTKPWPLHSGQRKQAPPAAVVEPTVNRLLLVWGVLVGGLGLLTINLFYVQVRQGPVLQELARQQQQIFLRPFVPRRHIVDRTGTAVALDRPVYSLFVHPKLFKESKEDIAAKLAPILNRPVPELVKTFNERKSGIRLEHAMAEDVAERIHNLQLDGLERIQYQQRFYPQRDVLATIVGYTNMDHRGQAGIELSQQKLLEREVKALRLTRMGDGSLMPDQVPGGFLNVDDLQLRLTVDTRLQRVALAALRQQVKQFQAKRGGVIVMDVRNGAILAMASEPSYDPNQYFSVPIERFKNWLLSDLYEPGSTFKPITVAIALEAKAIKPDSTFNDAGSITVDGHQIGNAYRSNHGRMSLTDIVQYSSNIGMVRIAQQMKSTDYYDWLKKIGLGSPVGIDLPGEIGGQFKPKEVFTRSRIEPAVTAFGQGFSLTPLQLVQLHAALANGGKLVTPHLVDGLYDSQGNPYWQPNLRSPQTVFSAETTKTVLPMMEAAVKTGTGKNAQIPNYRIAGKTGTAQKAVAGGYSKTAKITSFVGILPADNPRYVVLAVVDEPQGGTSAAGSTVAAPIVKTVMESLITLDQIPPSTTSRLSN